MKSGTTSPAEAGEASVPVDATETRGDAERSVSAPADQEQIDRKLSHEEFDPKGTLSLILLYFLILTLMWVFMYFVEFLGNDLIVVG